MPADATWTALADPHRRAVLGVLAEGAHAVGELVQRLGLSQPQASKHLRVLREAGLVRVERRAQRRIYTVDPAPMAELDAWLQPYRRLWNDRLDRLGAHLDAAASDADHDQRDGPTLGSSTATSAATPPPTTTTTTTTGGRTR